MHVWRQSTGLTLVQCQTSDGAMDELSVLAASKTATLVNTTSVNTTQAEVWEAFNILGYLPPVFDPQTLNLTILIAAQEEVWEVLNILEYSSARARMSVVARGPNGGIHVFTKGADARVGAADVIT